MRSAVMAGVAQIMLSQPVSPADFSHSYVVWAQGEEQCIYVVGDVYVRRSQLRQALAAEVHKENGVELLTSAKTGAKCIATFDKAAMKAGFDLVRDRPATSADRHRYIP